MDSLMRDCVSKLALRAPGNDGYHGETLSYQSAARCALPFYARFFAAFFFFDVLRFFAAFFFGTFAPAARASERPIAIACLRLLTFRPERPLFNVPAFRFFIARPTLADAFFEYFRAMMFLPVAGK
jgi:hypothetical protein